MSDSGASVPDQFYSGVIAEIYRHMRAHSFDAAPFARLIRRYGEPALELGCGDGDPLLDVVADGLNVEGLDSSLDMLQRCQSFAEQRGLHVVLHHATMEAMELGHRFKTIYLAGPTFNLLTSDAAAFAALARIRDHLLPGGVALIPLFVPTPTPPQQLGSVRSHQSDQRRSMRFSVLAEQRNIAERTQTSLLRYEIVEHDVVTERVDRDWILHWHSPSGFASLVESAGLDVVWVRTVDRSPVTDTSTSFSFLITRRSDVNSDADSDAQQPTAQRPATPRQKETT